MNSSDHIFLWLSNTMNLYASISIPLLFIFSGLSALVAPWLGKSKPQWELSQTPLFSLFNGMGAGALLCIGFMHCLAEGVSVLEDPKERKWLPEYPWGGFFALCGALCSLVIENVVQQKMREYSKQTAYKEAQLDNECLLSEKGAEFVFDDTPPTTKQSHPSGSVATEMYVLLIGLSFHSVFVGFTLGLSKDDLGLLLAVHIHQIFEGFALGTHICRAGLEKSIQLYLIYLLFSISAPSGIALGMFVQTAIENDATLYHIIDGIFQSFSGGVLVYLALVHLVSEELQSASLSENSNIYWTFVFGMVVGLIMLSVVAIWV